VKNKALPSLSALWQGVINSYSIIFFSKNRVFGIILLFASFLNPFAGICGVLSLLAANLIAYGLGFNPKLIENGHYGFNSLLMGLGLGVYYEFGTAFFLILLALASFLTLIITVCLDNVLGKNNLPFLTLPFIISIWLILLASRHFANLGLSERNIYWMNELYSWGGPTLINMFNAIEHLKMPVILSVYFKSLSAIFFQNSVITGMLIAAGLLFCSRISFTLSLISLVSTYGFYRFMGASIGGFPHIGFNFILTAIAHGGFIIIPSLNSYLWALILVPVTAILTISCNSILGPLMLPVYSLPFNLVVVSFMYALMMRLKPRFLRLVSVQRFSPEENLYKHLNTVERFKYGSLFQIHLPFWSEWMVRQGHNGSITHKDEWAHAFDFTIHDVEMKPCSGAGGELKDYYSFDKPVLAPADGCVEEVVNNIEDNKINEINLNKNWGNSIIIRHAHGLYTQISHLKKDSSSVKQGDFVKKGDIIGRVGNSGRSPQPHLHFQVQATPDIGSRTLDYPIAYYVQNSCGRQILRVCERPREGDMVSNVNPTPLLQKAFNLTPGEKLIFEHTDTYGVKRMVEWEIMTDSYNQSYIFCSATKSYAYFINDKAMFYFTDFNGSKDSMLFYFYLGLYRVLLGFYRGIEIEDTYPLNLMNRPLFQFFQDFISPLHIFFHTDYRATHVDADSEMNPGTITLRSKAVVSCAKKIIRKIDFEIIIEKDSISIFRIQTEGKTIHTLYYAGEA